MEWHTKTILRTIFAIILLVVFTVFFGALGFFQLTEDEIGGAILGLFGAVFMGVLLITHVKQLVEVCHQRRKVSDANILENMKGIQKYKTLEEMTTAYASQRLTPIYRDSQITITEEFLAEETKRLFFINGILDAMVLVGKANVVVTDIIEYVSLIFLYYDGKRYEIKYRIPFGGGDMKKIEEDVSRAVNILANKSVNFRQIPLYRFER